jgi:hypothetical protein
VVKNHRTLNLSLAVALAFGIFNVSPASASLHTYDGSGFPIPNQTGQPDGQPGQSPGQNPGQSPNPICPKPISWDEFKVSCKDPGHFGAQRPPQSIRINCGDDRLVWAVDPSAFSLRQERTLTTSLQSDKCQVGDDSIKIPLPDASVACAEAKEIREILNVTKSVTCDDVLAFDGSLQDFCIGVIDDVRKNDPSLIQRSETGRKVNTCNNGPKH